MGRGVSQGQMRTGRYPARCIAMGRGAGVLAAYRGSIEAWLHGRRWCARASRVGAASRCRAAPGRRELHTGQLVSIATSRQGQCKRMPTPADQLNDRIHQSQPISSISFPLHEVSFSLHRRSPVLVPRRMVARTPRIAPEALSHRLTFTLLLVVRFVFLPCGHSDAAMAAPSAADVDPTLVAEVTSPRELLAALLSGPPHILIQAHLDLSTVQPFASTLSSSRTASIRVRFEQS